MMNTLLATKNEFREFAQVKEAKGWYEYEPSYDGVIIHIDTAYGRRRTFSICLARRCNREEG